MRVLSSSACRLLTWRMSHRLHPLSQTTVLHGVQVVANISRRIFFFFFMVSLVQYSLSFSLSRQLNTIGLPAERC